MGFGCVCGYAEVKGLKYMMKARGERGEESEGAEEENVKTRGE